ncbi:unnamed protein product, partial [Chrysoparadoxa australica]
GHIDVNPNVETPVARHFRKRRGSDAAAGDSRDGSPEDRKSASRRLGDPAVLKPTKGRKAALDDGEAPRLQGFDYLMKKMSSGTIPIPGASTPLATGGDVSGELSALQLDVGADASVDTCGSSDEGDEGVEVNQNSDDGTGERIASDEDVEGSKFGTRSLFASFGLCSSEGSYVDLRQSTDSVGSRKLSFGSLGPFGCGQGKENSLNEAAVREQHAGQEEANASGSRQPLTSSQEWHQRRREVSGAGVVTISTNTHISARESWSLGMEALAAGGG